MHNGNTRPPALCAGEAPDEKLKINELGPNHQKSTECGIWPLIIMALPVFSTDQLSPGTNSSRTCARLCRRDFVLYKYLVLISDIRKRLVYERHLSTYLPCDRDRWYCHAVDGPPQNRSPQTVHSRINGPPGPNIAAIPGPPLPRMVPPLSWRSE